MSVNRIFALKVSSQEAHKVHKALKTGEALFGWSYVETADLRALKRRIDETGWNSLSLEEKDCYQGFLLDIHPQDYLVYINVPERGRCTAARVTGEYYWKWAAQDFNHRLGVDPASVFDFDRNDSVVHPSLSVRLKLRRRWWEIRAKAEFDELLSARETSKLGIPRDSESQLKLLAKEVQPLLLEIANRVHHTHPNKSLEDLLSTILEEVPGVINVEQKKGSADRGADILVKLESLHPITSTIEQRTIVIQVKSFEGEHWDTRAVADISRAFSEYPDASEGLIVSTASSSTEALEEELEKLRRTSGKPVALLVGEDVATFVLRHGWELMR